ncbi:hypothetical protein E4U21_000286 [Claviceps maximensis]|nr:hypothetical protein E4U21_000286 [Claviceps maximensis]
MNSDTLSRILQWRSFTAEHIRVCKQEVDDYDKEDFTHYFPNPFVSESHTHSAPMASSPAKRPREENPDEQLYLDLTPRPNRSAVVEDLEDMSISTRLSSKISKLSRTSSPTKRIIRAELQPTGFRQSSFAFDSLPPSLQQLSHKLRKIYLGDRILPSRLQDEFAVFELPSFFFSDSLDTDHPWPNADFVSRILKSAIECEVEGGGEDVWNMVHGPIISWLSENSSNEGACLSSQPW